MSEDQKNRYIAYLADCVTYLDLDKRAMEFVLEDFLKTQQELGDKWQPRIRVSSVQWNFMGSPLGITSGAFLQKALTDVGIS